MSLQDFSVSSRSASASEALGSDACGDRAAPAIIKPSINLVVPIRSLGENHRDRIASHLLSLDATDRYFRFGFSAKDEQITRYVDSLDFERDEIFGIYNRRLRLIAMAHLAFSIDMTAHPLSEFGVSVLPAVRGRGYGARLFDRAVMHARNRGVQTMYVHALSENAAMLKIAKNAGACIEREGAESKAYLNLPPRTLDTQWAEIVEEHMAQTNYQFKLSAKQFQDTFLRLQAVWRGASSASSVE